jgi:predicted phage terminase large subunit-like protein
MGTSAARRRGPPVTVNAFEVADQEFGGRRRRWPTPGAMAEQIGMRTRLGPYRSTKLTRLLDDSLVDVADGHTDRLMIFCPPQEGKSVKVSLQYPLWRLAEDPTLWIAIVSFQAGKAEKWGKEIRRTVAAHPELGIDWAPDSRAVSRLETTAGGGVICVGIKGAITGDPVDELVIDDPFAGRAEAESQTYRDAAWEWWEGNGSTRASGRFRVVLMHTRWHVDDLAGRMLVHEPGDWAVVSVPAIAEADDPLGREPGEELDSVQDRPAGWFTRLARLRSAYSFNSIYQQRPTLAAGGLFKRDDWRFWQPAGPGRVRLADGVLVADLRDCAKFITIDLASSTRTSADFTVAAAWAITPNGDLLCLDRARDRVNEGGHFELVAPLRQRWLGPYDVTHVESRMFGTTFVYAAGRAGLPLAELKADVDKVTRATAAADLVRQHRVWLPAAAVWLDEWLDEHADFPNATNDDQVDVCAYAPRVAITSWLPPETASPPRRAPLGEIDFESVAL